MEGRKEGVLTLTSTRHPEIYIPVGAGGDIKAFLTHKPLPVDPDDRSEEEEGPE